SPSFVDAPPTTEIYPLSLHDALPISRCEARSQPFATGTGWLCCPSSNTSLPSGPMLRSVANTSMSSVVDDTHSTSTTGPVTSMRSEEHTSELQSLTNLVCRLLLEQKT